MKRFLVRVWGDVRRASGRTVVGGARVVSGAEKKHLMEAAPFGRLDQMLWTTVYGEGSGGLCPLAQKLGGQGDSPPSAKIGGEMFFSRRRSVFLSI